MDTTPIKTKSVDNKVSPGKFKFMKESKAVNEFQGNLEKSEDEMQHYSTESTINSGL
jgi:hypothetical protein